MGGAYLSPELSHGSECQGASVGHEQNAIRDFFDVAELMNAGNDGSTGYQYRTDGAQHVAQLKWIERAEGLVENHDGAPQHQRRKERDALPFTARQHAASKIQQWTDGSSG
jgi:hypothetical protein